MKALRLGLAQINTTVGDLEGNTAKIREQLAAARAAGCDVVAFPELAVTGYPPEDLVLRRSFCEASREAAAELAEATHGLVAVVGFVDWRDDDAYNAAAVFADGRWVDTYDKQRLPNYGVFDEERYFRAGRRTAVYRAGGVRFGVSICEDIWYPGAPLDAMALAGAELCININASPYHRGKARERERMLATRAADNSIAVAYLNAVGGQDELVFDGASVVMDAEGRVVARARQFAEELLVVDVDLDEVAQRRLHDPRRRVELRARDWETGAEFVDLRTALETSREPAAGGPVAELMGEEEEVWSALVLATRDYLRKTGFGEAIVGLSGGIDSAVVAAVAVDAIGAERVIGVSMPSRYSSEHSKADARALAENLGIRFLTIPIEPAHAAMLEMLADVFEGSDPGTAEENLQARQRGNVLMTLSNKTGAIVLTTGNKSEMATGYATLYGDMAGGYAVLKDVPKTLVYRLARWRNARAGKPWIPERSITKPPSAELRPGQLDQDSLPPYEVLDPILEAYVEDDRTVDEIVAMGFERATVERVVRMVDRNEYKRRQAAPGVKITPRAFGRDRRLPLAAKYR
ncbi:NAD+ synthase [Tepidiforma thermophila]|uniref:Glutamine-dependent NAD(+) synthetase n=1 Tax=Tepidiforma thermophila (strain KCTC 52669 / CGMCC 1.13589 / G233) TaxID=2761530 RepID=A0A2A9HFZ3_TEPT2|nr:NAD+ synthase [Tepidiforma thermophila]PFG74062.1 NH(3)-dependent NAD(+) synthetase [Tepidiforma thermophila]